MAAAPEAVFEGALEAVLERLRLRPDAEARAKLSAHFRLLTAWNRRMNLTRVSDPGEAAERHFGESLLLASRVGAEVRSALDVGSGAGFPGLPLAALRPDIEVTLLDSVQRKAVFLREVSRSWGNVRVLDRRLEALEGEWDLATMRAVSPREVLPLLAERARSVALLVGEEGAADSRAFAGFVWEEPEALPWGRQRLLLAGRRS